MPQLLSQSAPAYVVVHFTSLLITGYDAMHDPESIISHIDGFWRVMSHKARWKMHDKPVNGHSGRSQQAKAPRNRGTDKSSKMMWRDPRVLWK